MYKSTIVSFYFDVKSLKDATHSVRPRSFYMEKGRATLKLPYPLIMFCDESTYEDIKQIREEELGVDKAASLTHYVLKNITDYDFYKENWSIVSHNRKSYACYDENNRNTPSYFLVTMFKIVALNIANQLNYFETPYYAWVDFGGSHIMRNFDEGARKMLDNPLERIRFCYIHFRGEDELRDMKSYYANGGPCGTGATAFTIQKEYISRFYNGIFAIFHETLFHGVGHSEEGVMTYFCHRYPELCDYYYGDYYSILSNYHRPVEDRHSIQCYFIDAARHKGREDLARQCENTLQA